MSTILVPLYIYPSSWSESLGSGWSPLFSALTTALTKNPSLEFLVVINPGNGPGPDYPIPNADYRAALSALSDSDRFPNVKVIGYVHCSYGQRDVEEVRKDVEGYLGWLEFAERGEWVSWFFSLVFLFLCFGFFGLALVLVLVLIWERKKMFGDLIRSFELRGDRDAITSIMAIKQDHQHRIASPITSNHQQSLPLPALPATTVPCNLSPEEPPIQLYQRSPARHPARAILQRPPSRRSLITIALKIAGAWTRLDPGRGSEHALEPGTAMISGTGDVPSSWAPGFLRSPDSLPSLVCV